MRSKWGSNLKQAWQGIFILHAYNLIRGNKISFVYKKYKNTSENEGHWMKLIAMEIAIAGTCAVPV